MMKRLAMVFVGLMLIVGNAWAVPDGIWKNITGAPAYSFYMQTYVGNAMLVIVAPNTETFWVFLDADDNYTNGFSASQDLSGAPNSLSITFTSDGSALANMTLTGQLPATYNLSRNAQAPSTGDSGDAPTLISPADGETIAVPTSASPYSMTWTAVTGAEGYIVQICTDNSCTNVISDDNGDWTSTGTSISLTHATAGFDFYWRVRADLGGGSYSPWSEIRRFHVSSS
ncbi:MAG: hypothetical protein HY788_05375 [Deltaproteobacteria bacterium]|nr:hypothetical protein [Deltaproteobacteria bacterium]